MNHQRSQVSTGDISFPDCAIGEFHCERMVLSFVSDGVFIDGVGFLDQPCKVALTSPKQISSRQHVQNEWADVEPTSPGGLRMIGEWSVDDGCVRLAGFNAESAWQEYVVEQATITLDIEPA